MGPSVITPEMLFNLRSKRFSVDFKALRILQFFCCAFIGKSVANSSVILKLISIPGIKIIS